MELQPIGDGIWLAEGRIVNFYGFAYPTRSVIVRLEGGGLWVWSPIELTPDLKHLVDELGEVAHLVSPNKIHHLFLEDWSAAYPNARLWGPQSTIAKRGDLSFETPLEDSSPGRLGRPDRSGVVPGLACDGRGRVLSPAVSQPRSWRTYRKTSATTFSRATGAGGSGRSPGCGRSLSAMAMRRLNGGCPLFTGTAHAPPCARCSPGIRNR